MEICLKKQTQLGDEKQFDEKTPNKVMKTHFDAQETNVVWSFCWRDFPDVQKKTAGVGCLILAMVIII